MKQLALDIGLQALATLDNFLPGQNQAVLQHLRLWTSSPKRAPVPTYIWGVTGSGKSHLLQAVADTLLRQGVATAWLNAAEQETASLGDAWQVLLLDDVHHYKAEQQHAAFQGFIHAQTHQRWVLATGACPPADLPLREDLRTRLGWGHVFELHALSEAERRAVLRQEADARGLYLSDEVMNFMLQRFSRDLSSLVLLLRQLDGYALLNQRALSIPLIKAMLAET